MLEASNVDRMMETSLKMFRASFVQGFRQAGGGAEQTEILDRYWGEASELISEAMAWKAVKEEWIDLYVDVFTEEDVAALLEFYQSPVGRKSLEMTPELMQRGGELGQRRMVVIQPELKAIFQRMAKELRPAAP